MSPNSAAHCEVLAFRVRRTGCCSRERRAPGNRRGSRRGAVRPESRQYLGKSIFKLLRSPLESHQSYFGSVLYSKTQLLGDFGSGWSPGVPGGSHGLFRDLGWHNLLGFDMRSQRFFPGGHADPRRRTSFTYWPTGGFMLQSFLQSFWAET